MSASHPYQKNITQSLDRIKEIVRSHPLSRATLEEIKQELLELASHTDWWSEDRFPHPLKMNVRHAI